MINFSIYRYNIAAMVLKKRGKKSVSQIKWPSETEDMCALLVFTNPHVTFTKRRPFFGHTLKIISFAINFAFWLVNQG